MTTIEEQKAFAAELMLMKNKAARLGLFKTMHAIEPATQKVGWEIAEHIEKALSKKEAQDE